MKKTLSLAAMTGAVTLMAGVSPVLADAIPYPNSGSYNPQTYTFTATQSGDITAYIVGGFTAGFDNELGLLVNGVSTGVFGLDNHSSSVGQSLDLGFAPAGASLTFVLQNNSLGMDAYSNPALNVGYDSPGETIGHNHIYSTAYTATSPVFPNVPTGTYVAFEDLPFPGSDFNYNDESFVFTGVALTAPDAGSSLGLFSMACAGIALLRRRMRA